MLPIPLMTEGVKIALISSAAAILGSIGLPKFYESVIKGYTSWLTKKNGNITDLLEKISSQKQKIEKQDEQIEELKNQLTNITTRMDILLPLLRRQLKDDPEAIELLAHFDLKTNTTSAQT